MSPGHYEHDHVKLACFTPARGDFRRALDETDISMFYPQAQLLSESVFSAVNIPTICEIQEQLFLQFFIECLSLRLSNAYAYMLLKCDMYRTSSK